MDNTVKIEFEIEKRSEEKANKILKAYVDRVKKMEEEQEKK